jgi:hypothetical protein
MAGAFPVLELLDTNIVSDKGILLALFSAVFTNLMPHVIGRNRMVATGTLQDTL